MTAGRVVLLVLCLLALASFASALPRTPRSISVLLPHHVRIAHHLVDTHPDLVVDSPQPHFTWQMQDVLDADGRLRRGVTQSAYQLQIVSQAVDGSYDLLTPTADTGRVESPRSTNVQHSHALQPNSRYLVRIKYWSSSGRESEWALAQFRTSMLDTWQALPAQWIGSRLIPMHQLKKVFSLPATQAAVTSATVQYSGLGYSTLWLNGKVVDPSRKLDPGWTTYEKRSLYVSLAVDSLITAGQNALAVELGNGWYSQEQYIGGTEEDAYGPPRLWLWLSVRYADNSSVDVYSDASWLGSTGPTIHDGVYMGSVLDNRWARPGWANANFTDQLSLWINASVLPSPVAANGVFSLQIMDPIRTPPDNLHIATSGGQNSGQRSLPPGVTGGDFEASRGGNFLPTPLGGGSEGQPFDLGQNIAGWCRFQAMGKRGMSLQVTYSETLQLPLSPQISQSLYKENLRNAASTDLFIFSLDDQMETFEPPFTVHGFRYVNFRGAKHDIQSNDIQCFFVHSETTLAGNFTTSNTVMNQVQHNIQWGQLSNLMSLPTDCSQRDERKGWMGDAGLTVDESLFNFDSANLYVNFLNLIRDTQAANGGVGDTVPLTFGNNPADPNWGTAYPTILWNMYRHYGDESLLRDHYAGAKAWVDYVYSDYKRKGGIDKLDWEYGDWVPPPPFGQTNGQLVAAFPFLRDIQTIISIATILGDSATVKSYQTIYATVSVEFHKAFFTNDQIGYANGYQTANALALALPGVVPQNLTSAVVEALVRDIFVNGHLTTGIVGVAQLFPVLSANGHHDVALFLAQSTTYPSYGWMFSNELEKATTLWELWDSPKEGPGMNSRNHIMFGSIGAWFYRDCAGIDLEGLELIRIRPRMGFELERMTSLAAEVVTIKGPVTVAYQRSVSDAAHSIELSVSVPHNARAVVHLEPLLQNGLCMRLVEGEGAARGLWQRRKYHSGQVTAGVVGELGSGVESVEEDMDTRVMRITVGSGSYKFTAHWQ